MAVAVAALMSLGATSAFAAVPAACKTVRFSDVGWTDITATTATTTNILKDLGYKTDIKILSVPVTYESLKNKDIDVFLGNWMPTMESNIAPFKKNGTVDVVRANLTGAKYTLATNQYGAAIGIKSFADIAKHKDALDGKIYGVMASWFGRFAAMAPAESRAQMQNTVNVFQQMSKIVASADVDVKLDGKSLHIEGTTTHR
ncbi:hypothetical protein COL154_014187 [Colletotrichum chrysophilum]|nr:hypothetical protein COL154_014187 [Colletotrichum chrysophilum]